MAKGDDGGDSGQGEVDSDDDNDADDDSAQVDDGDNREL